MSNFEIRLVDDSFAFLRDADDDVYDVIITDPPYDEHCQSNIMSGTLMKEYVNDKERTGAIPKVKLAFDHLKSYRWTHDLVRIAKRWALAFCTVEDLGRISITLGRSSTYLGSYVRGGIWYKNNAIGQLTGDRPAAAYEGIAITHGSTVTKRWNGKGAYGIWRCNSTRGKKGRHPNEKPLDLALILVASFSDRGETIFDPFCGSAAIGEAALLLGRKYVGLDKDRAWVARARKRLSKIPFGTADDQYALGLCRMSPPKPWR